VEHLFVVLLTEISKVLKNPHLPRSLMSPALDAVEQLAADLLVVFDSEAPSLLPVVFKICTLAGSKTEALNFSPSLPVISEGAVTGRASPAYLDYRRTLMSH
jgi:hypothetical protein